jgi:hypothetical protein
MFSSMPNSAASLASASVLKRRFISQLMSGMKTVLAFLLRGRGIINDPCDDQNVCDLASSLDAHDVDQVFFLV